MRLSEMAVSHVLCETRPTRVSRECGGEAGPSTGILRNGKDKFSSSWAEPLPCSNNLEDAEYQLPGRDRPTGVDPGSKEDAVRQKGDRRQGRTRWGRVTCGGNGMCDECFEVAALLMVVDIILNAAGR